jgi:AbrB family looped-hinge helix DNA binding protein
MAEEAIVTLQMVKGLTTKTKTYYRYQITVPAKVVERLGWAPGDMIGVTIQRGGVALRKKVFAPS